MPPREVVASLDEIRQAARQRVAASSFRSVAGEIGISHHALHRFVNGSEPYGRTTAKLRAWYAGEQNELIRLRKEVEELRKRVAELEKQLRERPGNRG